MGCLTRLHTAIGDSPIEMRHGRSIATKMKKMTLEEGMVWAEERLAELEKEAGVPLPQHMKDRFIAKISHVLSTPSEQLLDELIGRVVTSGQK